MIQNVFDGQPLDLPQLARRQHRSAVETIHAHEKNVTEPCNGVQELRQPTTLTSTLMGFWVDLVQGYFLSDRMVFSVLNVGPL